MLLVAALQSRHNAGVYRPPVYTKVTENEGYMGMPSNSLQGIWMETSCTINENLSSSQNESVRATHSTVRLLAGDGSKSME